MFVPLIFLKSDFRLKKNGFFADLCIKKLTSENASKIKKIHAMEARLNAVTNNLFFIQ